MTEETKQSLVANDLDKETKNLDKRQVEQRSLKESPEHFQNPSLELQTVNSHTKFAEKEREGTNQREAVIRPQQTGKIDFKSLHNHSFSSNRAWPNSKDSPQSPSGKNRNRDKAKKSGRGERSSPQQLYRLSITNARSNPTIGIAYPQQKISPPKKLEFSRGPVSGSYRFHVPNNPEREAELRQEDLHFRCFQEGSPNLNYTSQAVGTTSGGPAQHNLPSTPQQQKSSSIENNTQPINETLFPDFHINETDTWQSPERTFRNTSFGISSQKPNNLVEMSKTAGTFIPVPFQYGFPMLEESASDSFPCDQNTQPHDFDISHTSTQVPHNSFIFSSLQAHETIQNRAQLGNDQVEDRQSYQLHPKPPQYMQTPHGVSSTLSSNGESSASSTNKSELRKTVTDTCESFNSIDSRDEGFEMAGKRICHFKNGTTTQRVVIQGSVHQTSNVAQGTTSQINLITSPHNDIQNAVPLKKGVSKHNGKVSNLWDGPSKGFQNPLIDQTTPYNFQYQQSSEQRHNSSNNGRLPWPQICFTNAMPSQHRIDHPRQMSNQQLTYLMGQSDWQEGNTPHDNSKQKDYDVLSKKTNDSLSNQRRETGRQRSKTVTNSHFTNTLEMKQGQMGDVKKSVYFGVNHSVPVTSSRNCNYAPLHVGALGLKVVPPYDSPSNSPSQNPASSSTCSSLSPASINSVNSNPDDTQVPKVMSPQFYKQQQDKALTSSNNQHHYQSETSRSLLYNHERAKEVTASFMQNRNLKAIDNTYRTENNPPPSYSAHQLATSLVSANLDQLDVLLTCKQCDQNFNNLVSFLDHKQFCGQHAFAHNELKEVQKVEEPRKFQIDHSKAMSSVSSYGILRGSSDLHLSLLGLNKNGELGQDTDTKGDVKEDPMKLMLPTAPLPDLEVEDPKLDSLITEALNGLGYQSDNTEIDSSFIDAFVDDDLTTSKCISRHVKDTALFEPKTNTESRSGVTSQGRSRNPFDSDNYKSEKVTDNPTKNSKHKQLKKESLEAEAPATQSQKSNITQIDWEAGKSEEVEQENDYSANFLLSSKFSTRCDVKSVQGSTSLVKATSSSTASRSPTSQKTKANETKRKKSSGGSWSKELIHKIVQQKNKLHKLHVKGTKNLQFSLVMERLTPATQSPTFREYDYVSDSDDDCEPVKIASQGRLSQSIRCKYTYTKECKGRMRADKSRESLWKKKEIDCFDHRKDLDASLPIVKENLEHQRLRRRNSRSSTSSELSTSISISSDSISSPKSIDHTDSDSEKLTDLPRKEQDSQEQNLYDESPTRIRKESSTSLALTFTKNTKRYSTDKILLTEHKDHFTTSKCSSIICKTDDAASEHTLTTSTVSLARYKTTRVEIEGKGDDYGFETGILEEPFKAEFPKNITSPKESTLMLHQREALNNREASNVLKIKKEAVALKGKSQTKRTNSSECSAPIFEKANGDISSVEGNKRSKDLFPEPPPLGSSLLNKVCLSPSKDCNDSTQKECLVPYTSEQDQSLSFDSMFGDISVGGFENNLYPDIQLAKESFSPLETTTDKKEIFESSFSPFLEQRDWNLMDVNPVLPDEISHYKDDSDSTENNFNNIPFTLPEKIMDYTPNLNSSMSVDELEIKRIVTELESQLETAKLNSPPPLKTEPPKQVTMSKFSPLRLDPEMKDEDSRLEMNSSSDNLEMARPVDSHLTLFPEPDLPWSSPIPFGSICGQQGLHTPTHSSAINLASESENVHIDMKELGSLNSESSSSIPTDNKTQNNCLYKSEEMLEHEIYTENLMKSLEVISDSLSSGFTSPQSSPNQEGVVQEDHENLENEQNEFDNVEPMNRESELIKFAVETNTISYDPALDISESESEKGANYATIEDLNKDDQLTKNQGVDRLFKSVSEKSSNLKSELPSIPTHNASGDTQLEVKDQTGESDHTSESHVHLYPQTSRTLTYSETDIKSRVLNSKSPLCQDHLSEYSQVNNAQQVVSPDQDKNGYKVFEEKPNMDLYFARPMEQDPLHVTFTQTQPFSPDSIQNTYGLGDNQALTETVTHALSENRPIIQDKKPDLIHTLSSVDTFESAAKEVENSFISHLDFIKVSERGPGTLLAVDSISKPQSIKASECPEVTEATRKTGDLHGVKQMPINYSEACFNEKNFPSKSLNVGKIQSLMKNCTSTSNNSQFFSLPHNSNEQQIYDPGHDLPEISKNANQSNITSLQTSQSVCVEDNPVDSEQVSKMTTVNYVDHNLNALSIAYLEKLKDQVITNEHDESHVSIVLDAEKAAKPLTSANTSTKSEKQRYMSTETTNSMKKCFTQNVLEANFQCEVCAMFFRTQPGLKRHKAMKHVAKSEGNSPFENTNMCSHMLIPDPDESHPTEKALNDSNDLTETAVSHPNQTNALDGQRPQTVPLLTTECTARSSERPSENESLNESPGTLEVSSEIPAKHDTLTNEIVNSLKVPDLHSVTQQESLKSPSDTNHEFSVKDRQKGNYWQIDATCITEKSNWQIKEDDNAASDFDMNPNYLQEEDIQYSIANSLLNIKHEKTKSHTDDNGTGLDLKAFFDDESTFSELFPRNDDRKRKKCARVYGKSNKKQKQLSCSVSEYCSSGPCIDETDEPKENEMGQMLKDTNESSDYKTTTINNMNMLNVPPKSSQDQICHQTLYEEKDTEMKDYTYENKGMRKPLENQGESQDCTEPENTALTVPQEDRKLVNSDRDSQLQQENAAPLKITELLDNHISAPFVEPVADKPLITILPSTELNNPTSPVKKPAERKSRKRSEPGLKPKDKQYKCKVCFTWFLTLGELDFHKLSHNPSPPPTCYMCVQRKFSSREQLRDHLREKHGKNKSSVWSCGMCLKEISDVWMYNEHLREHATQFARRGQSQNSLLDMPGCFMQEHAVKNFLSSIMQHRSSRNVKGDNNNSIPKEDRRTSLEDTTQEANVTREPDSANLKTKTAFGSEKYCTLASLEVLSKSEMSVKNVEMHPNCKDPSRDCHHCGKQFPKPFKLQRHLVVHNLQKIFLCPKCPASYQETKELKKHLQNDHKEPDEQDSKHTTLYTCELCADVMHVIKKSFICSTCNYTFSKKEQFDRHMEKHLVGGNMIFKFRGVVRPTKPFTSMEVETGVQPSKKRKTTQNSTDITVSHDQENLSVLSITDNQTLNGTEDRSIEPNNTSVKIEDVAEDFQEEAKDVRESAAQTDSAEQCLPSIELKEEIEGSSPSHAIQNGESMEVHEAEICDVKIEDDSSTIPEIDTASISKDNTDTVGVQSSGSLEKVNPLPVTGEADLPLLKQVMEFTPGLTFNDSELKSVKQSSKETGYLKQDPTTESLFPIWRTEDTDGHNNQRETSTTALVKHISTVKSGESLKETLENNTKCLSSAVSAHYTRDSYSSEDKDSKQQKKKKEPKPPHSLTTARENLHIDPKIKKRFRPSKCENIDGQKKNDHDYPVLTSVKEDIVSNKIIPKHKAGSSTMALQVKRDSMESFPQKKVEIVRHFKGDCKGRKAIPKGPIHSPSSRIPTLNSTFNKPRPKPGVRSIETHSYRTAESQNNILSQLFGQRLTSFKIPLRKDTSESIN